MTILVTLHVLAAVVWVGGMFFADMVLRQSVGPLEPAVRLAERFGTDVVYRANNLTQPPGVRLAPTLDFLDDRTRG